MKKRTKYGGYAGFDFNNPKTDDLVFAVGKLIMNFGAVEFQTYRLIDQLGEDTTDHDAALDLLFMKRFRLIERLARQQSMPDEILSDIETVRDPVEEMAAFRNKIAHNPIVQGWKGKVIEGKPGSFGVIDIKSQKGKDRPIVDIVSLEKLNLFIDAVAELATNLESILDAVTAEMGKRTQS